MRTTISLDDGLLEDAKRRAAETGTTLSELIARALRAALSAQRVAPRPRPFRLVGYGRGGFRPGVSLGRIHEVLESEEVSGLRPAKRRRS